MLSAVTWTIDQAQSNVEIAIPDQPFELDDGMGTVYEGTLRIRNQSGSDGGPWNVGNSAAITGTIATDYTDGSSIEFLLGQSNISGVNSGSYIPDPANWNGTDFGGSLAPGPGVFGGRLRPTVTLIIFPVTVDVGHFNFTDVQFDAGSGALPITAGSFPANTTDIGISSALANLKGLDVLGDQLLDDTQALIEDLLTTNQAPTGTITSPDPLGQPNLRQLTIPIVQDFSLELGPGTPPFTGSISGQIVATTTLVDESSIITARNIFYNNSLYDGDAGASANDLSAIDTSKTAYLAGQGGTLTGANSTAYDKGINGIIVELTGTHGPITSDDFTVRMSEQNLGANNTPSTWAAAPTPSVTVFSDSPVPGTDRVHLIFPDGSITNRYLQVIVEGDDAVGGNNTNTGLATSDIFFYANVVGDTFNDVGFFGVDATDELAARNNQGFPLTPVNSYDFTKDFSVDATDQLVARNNGAFMLYLGFSNPPAAPSGDDDGAGSGVASALAATSSTTSSGPSATNSLADRLDDAASEPPPPRQTTGSADTQLAQVDAAGRASDSAANDRALDDDLLKSLLDDLLE